MTKEIAEFKEFWKDLMAPVYDWLSLTKADEKWSDGGVIGIALIVITELATW
ncbi:hypothetical protein [Levilactobacillus namurensis]|uniref:hypothetical protein n=1 Tax=Levilactobacillus namurensis TaxID=380393 RepID=UPI001DA38A05|nr:hypothetical protein [Levilactobacillus namurensis]HJE44440.1 hypothetical protein [Levilactobacillus namurensis]